MKRDLTLKEKLAIDLVEKLTEEQKREILLIGLINAYSSDAIYTFLKEGYKCYKDRRYSKNEKIPPRSAR